MSVDTSEIQITKIGEEPGSTSLQVEVAVERVRTVENKATATYAKRVKLPGFRKGKVPPAVVKRQFRDAIREAVIRDLIAESWKTALDQEDLKPIADPRVKDLHFKDGEPLRFQLEVDVKPEIELERLSGFQLTRKVQPISDDMVDSQIDEMRRKKAPWVPVEDTAPVPGEMVSVSIATIEDGKAAEEPKPYQIVLGQGQAIPALEEEIMRLKAGESTKTTVRYPDDFPDESKRGQPRTVHVSLHEVKRLDTPPFDDAFAAEVGDFDSAEALRNAVREDLEGEAKREAEAAVRQQLVEQVVSANGLEAPRSMVQRLLSGYAQAYEVPDDQLEKFASEFQPIAERQVQRDLIIDFVAGREGLAATEEDLDRRIEEIATRRNAKPGEVYSSLQKAGRLREIEHGLTEEKVFEYMMTQSTIIEE